MDSSFCFNCGKEIPVFSKYCRFCGADQNSSERLIIEDKAKYEGGYYQYNKKIDGMLILSENRLVFQSKNFAFQIPIKNMMSLEELEKKRISGKKAIAGIALAPFTGFLSLALIAKRDKVGKIIVGFSDEKGEIYAPIFDVGQRYKEWKEKISEVIEAAETGNVKVVRETFDCLIKNVKNGIYGKVLLETTQGEYHGGHKAFLAGGVFADRERGQMYLTERFLIFCRRDCIIKVPLDRVLITGWTVTEDSRRRTISGAVFGGAGPGLLGPTFGGMYGGVLQESGKKHQIVLPYIDENGIPQEPRFAVWSITGKVTKEWAKAIYERIVEIKKSNADFNDEKQKMAPSEDDPIKILKIRLAKGEITLEEYERMKKILES